MFVRAAVRVNPPAARDDHIPAHMSTVGDTHKTDDCLFAKLAAKNSGLHGFKTAVHNRG